ncbi:MAG: DUF6089 family protein [Bacteroidota bacterium]
MFKKTIVVLLLFFSFTMPAFAQRHQLGLFLGVANYNGELNPAPINYRFIHPGLGIIYRFDKSKFFSYKASAYYGWVSGNDAQSKDSFQLKRNLSFFSHVLDVSGEMEFNFFPYQPGTGEVFCTPYIFAGISIFHFNPTANLNGHEYELRTMHTEGQGDTYSKIAGAFRFGGGIKLSVGQVVNIGFEVGVRKTYTDYLDDVSGNYPDPSKLLARDGLAAVGLSNKSAQSSESLIGRQRGNPNDNDWYVFSGFWITFNVFSVGKHACDAFPHFKY